MSKSPLTLIGFSFAVGVAVVVLVLPLLTGESRLATATTAKLAIQKALPSVLSTSPLAARTAALQRNRSSGVRRGGADVLHPGSTTVRNLAEPLSLNDPPPKRRERLW